MLSARKILHTEDHLLYTQNRAELIFKYSFYVVIDTILDIIYNVKIIFVMRVIIF